MENTVTIQTELVNEKCVVLALSGRFDSSSANILKDVFKQVIGGGVSYVVVDMENVWFIDSGGLSSLISAVKITRTVGGDVLIAGMQPQAESVFSLTMLDQVMSIYSDRQAALDSLPL